MVLRPNEHNETARSSTGRGGGDEEDEADEDEKSAAAKPRSVDEIQRGRVAWQGTWDKVWLPTVTLTLPCIPTSQVAALRHPEADADELETAERDAASEAAQRALDEDAVEEAVETAVESAGVPEPPPDFVWDAPPVGLLRWPPAPDFEDHPAGAVASLSVPPPPPPPPPSPLPTPPSSSPSPSPSSTSRSPLPTRSSGRGKDRTQSSSSWRGSGRR